MISTEIFLNVLWRCCTLCLLLGRSLVHLAVPRQCRAICLLLCRRLLDLFVQQCSQESVIDVRGVVHLCCLPGRSFLICRVKVLSRNVAGDRWTREVQIEGVSKQERPAILQRKRYVPLGQRVAQQVTR